MNMTVSFSNVKDALKWFQILWSAPFARILYARRVAMVLITRDVQMVATLDEIQLSQKCVNSFQLKCSDSNSNAKTMNVKLIQPELVSNKCMIIQNYVFINNLNARIGVMNNQKSQKKLSMELNCKNILANAFIRVFSVLNCVDPST